VKNGLRIEWDGLVQQGDGEAETRYIATRMFPFFYDMEFDKERGVELLRWLVPSKEEVNNWLRNRDTFPRVLIRLMAVLMKSVGSVKFQSEYSTFGGFFLT
jgi:hypothetical protein